MRLRHKGAVLLFATVLAALCVSQAAAQGVKRIVIVKVDGLPTHYVDRTVRQTDKATGKSVLPWIEEVFYKNGTRVPNFYSRGMSLSGPAWGQLDTGQRLQLKGNVEYDRLTLHAYDYLNFIPFYTAYGLGRRKADMPAVEVMDQLGIPLLCDAFNYPNRYTSQQLYQRGNSWEVIASGFLNMYPGNPSDMVDEWTLGLEFRRLTINQAERDVIAKLSSRPDIDYFDYYDIAFDHASHHNNDDFTRVAALKDLDRTIGRIWEAIRASSRADETAMVLISDHGFNADPKVYSQGFNLVKMLGSPAGGGHHTVTKRRLMLDYSLKGLYPFVPLIKTHAQESFYLRDKSSEYPTALLDFDGNERSSIHFRNSDLNVLHILLQQLKGRKLPREVDAAARDAFFDIIEKKRSQWRSTMAELGEELDALQRWINIQEKEVAAQPKKFTPEEIAAGTDKEARRAAGLLDIAVREEKEYRQYIGMLTSLTSLTRETFDARRIKIEDLIAPGTMGESNTLHQLQNYVVGPARTGFVLNADKDLDIEQSFIRVNYFDVLRSQRVKNNVQDGVSNRPVDFVAVRLPSTAFSGESNGPAIEDAVWIYGDNDKQALIFSRTDEKGEASFRYQAVSGLKQKADGSVVFERKEIGAGFPLKYFEAAELAVPANRRVAWFNEWHNETEWLDAIHKTKYSNALIGLNEQLDRHPIFDASNDKTSDVALIKRFRQRQRALAESDLLILANDHWNFDVRGFNPGGNHGSFFRVSTNSTFMMAGGEKTGIPRGLSVETPYDSLSFVPTILRLMGKVDDQNRPLGDLGERGFRQFPGRVVTEITGKQDQETKR